LPVRGAAGAIGRIRGGRGGPPVDPGGAPSGAAGAARAAFRFGLNRSSAAWRALSFRLPPSLLPVKCRSGNASCFKILVLRTGFALVTRAARRRRGAQIPAPNPQCTSPWKPIPSMPSIPWSCGIADASFVSFSARDDAGFVKISASPSSLTSVPDHLPDSTRPPGLTASGRISPRGRYVGKFPESPSARWVLKCLLICAAALAFASSWSMLGGDFPDQADPGSRNFQTPG